MFLKSDLLLFQNMRTIISGLMLCSMLLTEVRAQSTPETISIKCNPCNLKNKVYTLTPEKLDLKRVRLTSFHSKT